MKEEKFGNLKMGVIKCANPGQRVPLFFIEKQDGFCVRLQDVIAYLTFKLSNEILDKVEGEQIYEEGRNEKEIKEIASTLEVLINAYKTGLF